MSGPLLEPKEIKAPGWMTPTERQRFRRLLRSELGQNSYVSQRKFDGICDYVCACSRLDDLRKRLGESIAANSPRDVDKARILALNTQVNALIALRQKLGDAL